MNDLLVQLRGLELPRLAFVLGLFALMGVCIFNALGDGVARRRIERVGAR